MTIHQLPYNPQRWLSQGRPDPRLPAADIETLQYALFDCARLLRVTASLLRHKNLRPEERDLILDGLEQKAIDIDLSAFAPEVRHAVVGSVPDTGITMMAAYFGDGDFPDGVA